MRRRRLQGQQPYPIVGKVAKRQLEAVQALCRPGEQPRFVIGEGIYGSLVAFDDRAAIVKKGLMTSWMTGAVRRGGREETFPYDEIGEVRFSVKRFTGKLEIVLVEELDGRDTFWKQSVDVHKRADAMAMTVDVFEKAEEHIQWLRGQIAGPGRLGADDELIHERFGRALIEQVRDPVLATSFPAPDAVVHDIVDAVLAQLVLAIDDERLSPLYRDWVADYTDRPYPPPP